MPILRRINEDPETIWRPVPEGLWRFIVGKPLLVPPDRYGWQVRFPLMLTEAEKDRTVNELGDLEPGEQQSSRVTYQTGLSLMYMKDGKPQTTRLIDFLTACLGSQNTKKFREWCESGGGPPKPADRNDDKAELALIEEWLGWWDNLEVYGTVTHKPSTKDPTKPWAQFAGPMAVGSLPGQKDDEYQAHGRGKLRAIIQASEDQPVASGPAVRYTPDGKQVPGDGSAELPF